MTYPLSSDVAAGQPTASAHYNNLRGDALRFGQAEADVVKLGTFLSRYARGIDLQYLATGRVRIPYVTTDPPTLLINGFMCQAVSNVDLGVGLISGGSATWYIFAQRIAGSSSFTLTANTSATEGVDQRIIGEVEWSGTAITNVKDYFASSLGPADYDSGWFACAGSNTYTKGHGLNQVPRLVIMYHSQTGPGTDELIVNPLVCTATPTYSPIGMDANNIYIQTGTNASYATCFSTRRTSAGGYYRVLAWK